MQYKEVILIVQVSTVLEDKFKNVLCEFSLWRIFLSTFQLYLIYAKMEKCSFLIELTIYFAYFDLINIGPFFYNLYISLNNRSKLRFKIGENL